MILEELFQNLRQGIDLLNLVFVYDQALRLDLSAAGKEQLRGLLESPTLAEPEAAFGDLVRYFDALENQPPAEFPGDPIEPDLPPIQRPRAAVLYEWLVRTEDHRRHVASQNQAARARNLERWDELAQQLATSEQQRQAVDALVAEIRSLLDKR
ncbi:MAG: hypothetical protein AB7S38_10045 [Vulcanimicrobiota bacterium]